jgi:phosphatidylserine synthase
MHIRGRAGELAIETLPLYRKASTTDLFLCFLACGVSCLARYNVTAEKLSDGGDKVRYFESTPGSAWTRPH